MGRRIFPRGHWADKVRLANLGDYKAAAEICAEVANHVLAQKVLPEALAQHVVQTLVGWVEAEKPLEFFPVAPRRRGRPTHETYRHKFARALRCMELERQGYTLYGSGSKPTVFHMLALDEGVVDPEAQERRAASLRRQYERERKRGPDVDVSQLKYWPLADVPASTAGTAPARKPQIRKTRQKPD